MAFRDVSDWKAGDRLVTSKSEVAWLQYVSRPNSENRSAKVVVRFDPQTVGPWAGKEGEFYADVFTNDRDLQDCLYSDGPTHPFAAPNEDLCAGCQTYMDSQQGFHVHTNGVVEVFDAVAYLRHKGADVKEGAYGDVYIKGDTVAECGSCGRMWDDGVSTSATPTPGGRCPFESEHEDEEEVPAPKLYAITATVTHHTASGESTSQVPTFYLHPNVQGILSEEHARRVAMGILSAGVPDGGATVSIHVTAVKVAL